MRYAPFGNGLGLDAGGLPSLYAAMTVSLSSASRFFSKNSESTSRSTLSSRRQREDWVGLMPRSERIASCDSFFLPLVLSPLSAISISRSPIRRRACIRFSTWSITSTSLAPAAAKTLRHEQLAPGEEPRRCNLSVSCSKALRRSPERRAS